jgi:SsrA-binding protein
MSKKPTHANVDPNARIVAQNRRARHEYEILDQLDCGIVLTGSEVKSVRNNKVALDEAYARIRDGELWLLGCDIAEYGQASWLNHEPRRPRKLLLRKAELRKFAEAAEEKGLTLVPLKVYLDRGFVKVTIAVARGRKLHDKRDRLRRESDQREMRREMSRRG